MLLKNKSTWIFLIFVATLGGFTFWDFYSDKKTEDIKTQNSVLIPFDVNQIQSLSLSEENQKIILDKTVDGWKFIAPLQDYADSPVVEEFLSQLTQQKSLSVISKVAPDISIYGLKKPIGEISVTHQNKQTIIIEIGSEQTVEQNSYLRNKETGSIVVGGADWNTWIKKTPSEFRDRRFLRSKMSAISEIEVKNSSGGLKLKKNDNTWTLAGQPEIQQDQNRIREILNQFTLTKADEIILEKNISAADKYKYNLDKPQIQLTLKISDKLWSAQLSQTKDKAIYAITSDPIFLIRLEESLFSKLKGLKKLSFKDRSQIFEFNKDQARKIDLKTSLKKQSLILKDSKWVLDTNDTSLSVDHEKVTVFLDNLKKLGLIDFIEESKNGNINNNNPIEIKITDDQNNLIFEFQVGESVKKKFDNIERNLRLAKTNLSKNHFYIEQSEIDKLKLSEMISNK